MEGLTHIDIILVQLAIVFLPGLIWAQIDARYAVKRKPRPIEFFIRAFLFGISTYLVAYLGYAAFGHTFSSLDVDPSGPARILLDDFVDEILISAAIAFVLAIIWIYVATYRLLNRLLIWTRATNKYGDEYVWDFMFNSSQGESEYVHVRDFEKGMTYTGWVSAFSETEQLRELLLRDVIVYTGDSGESTAVPLLYLARDGADIHIEFPYRRPRRREEGRGIRWLKKIKPRLR